MVSAFRQYNRHRKEIQAAAHFIDNAVEYAADLVFPRFRRMVDAEQTESRDAWTNWAKPCKTAILKPRLRSWSVSARRPAPATVSNVSSPSSRWTPGRPSFLSCSIGRR